MTEHEWLEATDPTPMLKFLQNKASDRKLRLFACGCCRSVWNLLPMPESRLAVEVAEQFADGHVGLSNLAAAQNQSDFSLNSRGFEYAATWATRERPQRAARWITLGINPPRVRQLGRDSIHEKRIQSDYVRCLFGPLPFRSVPVELPWLTPSVLAIVGNIYNERAFDRLPHLADALENAGCVDEDILAHCRNDEPHVRGCWVLDLLSGRE